MTASCLCIYFLADLDAVGQIFIGCGQHQFDSVDLVYLAGTRVIIDGYDIGARICISQFFYNAFADDVVWQTSEWLCAYDVSGSLMNQLNHFSG